MAVPRRARLPEPAREDAASRVDGSERRRGRPTLSAEYGLGLALNAGDALTVLSYAQGIAGAALDASEEAFAPAAPGPDREFVRALVPYMLDRRA